MLYVFIGGFNDFLFEIGCRWGNYLMIFIEKIEVLKNNCLCDKDKIMDII